MASINKRVAKNGEVTWQLVFELGNDPVTGKRQRVFKTVKGTKKQAQAVMDKMKVELERGYYCDPSSMLLKDWITQWLDNYLPNIEATTRTHYRDDINRHIIPDLGHVMLKQLKTTSIQSWVNDLSDKKGLSPKSVRNIYMNLKAALTKAVILRMLPYNPCEGVVLPKATKYKATIYTVQEMNHLLDVARGTDMFIPVLLATNLGLRRGEVLALKWEHIDFDNAIVHICENKVITENGALTKAPKSAAGIRDITLGASVLRELKYAHAQYNRNKLAMGPAFKDSGLVFSQEDGGAYRPESLTKMWNRFLDNHQLKHVRFHDLRHSCATALLEAGVDPKTVQNRLGHSDITMTLNIYAHCTQNMDRNAAQKLDDLFANAI